MSTSRWSAVVQHIATRRIVAELPIESAKATSIRNAPGSLNVSIPLVSTAGLSKVATIPGTLPSSSPTLSWPSYWQNAISFGFSFKGTP